MKKMKGLAVIFTAAALWVGLSACADNGGGGSAGSAAETVIKFDTAGTASVPEIAKDSIIRNKVVNLNGSTDVYYEYLKFTSEDAGEYKLYKDNGKDENGEEKEKTEVTTLTGYTIPTSFTYDKTTGKVVTTTAGDVYFFDSGTDKILAKEILTTTAATKALLDTEWKNSVGDTFKFDNFGSSVIKLIGKLPSYPEYTNTNGWVSASSLSFFWGTVGTETNLYYPAYKTDRATVTEYGKCIDSSADEYEFVSSDFLFLK